MTQIKIFFGPRMNANERELKTKKEKVEPSGRNTETEFTR